MIVRNFTLELETKGFCDVHDVTEPVSQKVAEAAIQDGSVTIFTVGSTAGVTVVEFEPGLVQDLEDLFDRLAPARREYHHEEAWHDGNGFSHVRASLLKPSLVVPVARGKMRLGTWQQIVVVDFDNRSRRREVAVQVMGV